VLMMGDRGPVVVRPDAPGKPHSLARRSAQTAKEIQAALAGLDLPEYQPASQGGDAHARKRAAQARDQAVQDQVPAITAAIEAKGQRDQARRITERTHRKKRQQVLADQLPGGEQGSGLASWVRRKSVERVGADPGVLALYLRAPLVCDQARGSLRAHLRSGETLRLEEQRISLQTRRGAQETAEGIRAMATAFRERGWTEVRLYGSMGFQQRCAAECARQGIKVANPELREVWMAEAARQANTVAVRNNAARSEAPIGTSAPPRP